MKVTSLLRIHGLKVSRSNKITRGLYWAWRIISWTAPTWSLTIWTSLLMIQGSRVSKRSRMARGLWILKIISCLDFSLGHWHLGSGAHQKTACPASKVGWDIVYLLKNPAFYYAIYSWVCMLSQLLSLQNYLVRSEGGKTAHRPGPFSMLKWILYTITND